MTRVTGMVLGGCIFLLSSPWPNNGGGVMSVSSSNTNHIRIVQPVVALGAGLRI